MNRPLVPEDLHRAARAMPDPGPVAMLGWAARAQAVAARRSYDGAIAWLNAQRLSAQLERVTKAAIGAGSTTDSTLGTGPLTIGQWSDAARGTSAFYKALADNFLVRIPMHETVGLDSSTLSAAVVTEGAATPVAKAQMINVVLAPQKVARILAYTENVILAVGGEGESTFNRGLLSAISVAADVQFLARMAAGLTPITSSSPLADLRAAFAAVVPSQVPRLFFVGAVDVGAFASTLPTTKSGAAFAGASVGGAGQLAGLPLLITAGAAPGSLYLIDGAQVVANGTAPETLITAVADLEMSTTPASSSTTPAGAQLVSLFQTDTLAIRCTADVAAEKLRNSGAALITGIDGTKWAAV